MNELIIKLQEIESILLVYGSILFEKDKMELKKEFNKTLTLLRMPLFSNRWTVIYKTPQDIIDYLIKYCGFKEDFAINKTRKREVYMEPRQIAQTISRFVFRNESLNYVGSYFINSDHSTVLHSIKTVKNLSETDKKFKEYFNNIQIELLGDIYI